MLIITLIVLFVVFLALSVQDPLSEKQNIDTVRYQTKTTGTFHVYSTAKFPRALFY